MDDQGESIPSTERIPRSSRHNPHEPRFDLACHPPPPPPTPKQHEQSEPRPDQRGKSTDLRLLCSLPRSPTISTQPFGLAVINAARLTPIRHRPEHQPRSHGNLLHYAGMRQLRVKERSEHLDHDARHHFRESDVIVQGSLLPSVWPID